MVICSFLFIKCFVSSFERRRVCGWFDDNLLRGYRYRNVLGLKGINELGGRVGIWVSRVVRVRFDVRI